MINLRISHFSHSMSHHWQCVTKQAGRHSVAVIVSSSPLFWVTVVAPNIKYSCAYSNSGKLGHHIYVTAQT